MSVEQHGLKFTVDTTGVAKGFRDYKSAVEGIFASLDQFEAHVTKTMKGVASAANNKTALNSFKNALNAFGDAKISSGSIRAVGALSAAMKDFRAPNAAQSTNLRTFGKALAGLPNLTNVYRTIKSIDDLNIAMRGFKAPAAAQAKNLIAFANSVAAAGPKLKQLGNLGNIAANIAQINAMAVALGRLKVPSSGSVTNLGNFALAMRSFNFGNLSSSGNLFATLAGLSNFRAPSAAQTKNLVEFVKAVNQIKVPGNGSAIASYLHNISAAAAQANGSMVRFRGGMGSAASGFSSFSRGASHARVEMMGLQNAFSGTFQIGSLLRSLLGGLTIGELGRSFFEATQSANQFHASMMVVTSNLGEQEAAWKRAQMAADHFGVNITTYSDGFAKFAAAAHESGASLKETTKIYEGFQTVITAMHLGTEQQQSVGLALREGMDRGYVSTQILTRQLGLVLPGALATAQAAWKKANGESANFFDALKKRQVDSIWLFDQLATKYAKDYGPALKQALESPIQQFTILKNRFTQFEQAIAKAGAQKAFADLIAKVSSYLDPEQMERYAKAISDKLVVGLTKAGQMVDWFAANWGKIKGPLGEAVSLFGRWMVISGLFKIGSSIVTPLWGAVAAAKEFGPKLSTIKKLLIDINKIKIGNMFGTLFSGGMGTIGALQNGLAKLTSIGPAFLGLGTSIKAGLTAPLEGLLVTTGMVAAAIVGGIAGAFGTAVQVGRDAGVEMQHDQYTTGEIIKGGFLLVGDFIGGIWGKINEGAQWLGDQIGIPFKGAADFIAKAFFSLYYVFVKVGEMIVKTAQGIGEGIGIFLGSKISGLIKIGKGDFAGAYADLGKGVADSFAEGFSNRFRGFRVNSADMAQKMAEAGLGADALLTMAGKRGRGKPQPGVRPGRKPTGQDWLEAQGDAQNRDPHYQGSNGSGGKKKGKADKALHQLEGEVNSIDSILKKLNADDPVGKIVADWTATLDGAAKVFLNKDGFTAAVRGIGRDSASSRDQLAALEAQIRKGNFNDVARKAMAAKGLTPDQLIAELEAARADIDDKIKQALQKQFTDSLKKQNDGLKRLAEDDLVLKVRVEASEDIQKLAVDFLNPEAYTKMEGTLRALAAGGGDVETAITELQTALKNGGAEAGLSADVIDRLSASLGKSAMAYRIHADEAARNMDVVGSFFKKEEDALAISRLSANAQADTAKMQELVNAARERGIILSKEQMSAAEQRIAQMREENALLEKQKTLFENNGMRQYTKDSMQAADLVNTLDHDAMQGLEDTLTELGTTGKLNFSNLLKSIQGDLIKYASKGVTSQIVNLFHPNYQQQLANGENPSLTGGLLGRLGIVPKGANNNAAAYKSTDDLIGQFGDKSAAKVDPLTGMLLGQNGSKIAALGTTPMNAMYVRMADSTTPGLLGAANDNTPGLTGALGGATSSSGPGFGGVTGAPGNPLSTPGGGIAGTGDAITAATTNVSKSFMQQMSGVMPLVGMAFAGSFKSPIAQIAVMFGTMILSKLMAGGGGAGGAGGIGGALGSLFGGGGGGAGGLGSIIGSIGLFKEGGISNGAAVNTRSMSPSAFVNAPHYREGTPNTSGIPAVLHDNEAVIPLSRGRKIGVELNGSMAGNQRPVVNNNFNISTPDADSFKQSKQQLATQYHVMANRSYSRNNR